MINLIIHVFFIILLKYACIQTSEASIMSSSVVKRIKKHEINHMKKKGVHFHQLIHHYNPPPYSQAVHL